MSDPSHNRHVAILTANFSPELTGSGQVISEFANFLTDRGIEVRVATSMPYYPQWRIWPDYRGAIWRTERQGRLLILRSWHWVSPRVGTVSRILQEVTLSLFALPIMLRALWRAKAAFILSPALTYAFLGSILAWVLRVPRHLIVHDVMPETAIELGLMSNKTMISFSAWISRGLYGLASDIRTLGEGMRQRIVHHTGNPDKIKIVPITIDPTELTPVPIDENEFRRRFVPEGTFAVLHTGNMGMKQDLHILLRAARRLRSDPQVRFYVFGDGAAKEEFLHRRRHLGLDNVSHHPLQERWLLPHMLCGADVVVVTQLPEVVDIVVPSKLVTALGAGALVIAACSLGSETERLVSDSGGGLVIPAGDDEALVREIRRIQTGEVNVKSIRESGRAYAQKTFDRAVVYGPIADSLASYA